MAPILSPDVVGYLGPRTNEADAYIVQGDEVSPSEEAGDDQITRGTDNTLAKRGWWLSSRPTAYKNSMTRNTGPWYDPKPQPWPKKEIIFPLGKVGSDGQHMKERVTLAKCITNMPNTLSTDYVNGEPGTDYANKLIDSIHTLSQVTNRWDREWAFEEVVDRIGQAAESDGNQDPLCRQTEWRYINYFRNPADKGNPMIDLGWEDYPEDGTIRDKRIPKKKQKKAQRDGKDFGNSAYALESLNCTVGNDTAPLFVDRTKRQISEIDGNWWNSEAARQDFNATVNDASEATCDEWNEQDKFVKTAREALNGASADNAVQNQQSRYFFEGATTQLENRQISMAPSQFAAGSLAGTAALASVLANYMF